MTSDVVLQADRFQSTPDALRKSQGLAPALTCPRHGTKLWATAGGAAMACVSRGETKDTLCAFSLGIDLALMATAV